MPDQFLPYSGVRRNDDAGPYAAAEAARILRQHFGFAADPENPDSGMGDPTGALQLAGNRDNVISELENRLPNEEGAAAIPVEGYVPGEPGRKFTSHMAQSNVITDRARLAQLVGAEHADPFTGDAEQARTKNVQDALDTAATTQRTEIGDAARTDAQRNAFATYMKERGLKMGDYEAASSPAAQAASMVPVNTALSPAAQQLKENDLLREQRLRMSPQLQPGQTVDEQGRIRDAPIRTAPNATEETQLRAIDNTFAVVRDLKALLDPSKNQITNALSNRALFTMYKAGIDPATFGADPQTRKRFQLASLVQVLGSTPYANQSRNYQFIQDVREHLTNPVATDQFLYGQIQELEKRLPEFRDTLERVHKYPFERPEGMPGGDATPGAAPGEVSATIRSDAPAAAPRHPKYDPPTVEEFRRR